MSTPAEEITRLQQQIDRCDPEAMLDLLIANRQRIIRDLRKALRKLRADLDAQAAAHERLAARLGLSGHETA
jgi:hypothetical protein